MERRTFLVGCGSVAVTALAGCLGSVGLDEYSSLPAAVTVAARDETGYDEIGVEPIEIREEFEVSDHEEEVSVTNYVTEHEKTVDFPTGGEQEAAVFHVFTSPEVGIAGVNLNPIEEMETEEVLEHVQRNYDEIDELTHEQDDAIHVLEEATTASLFTGRAEFDGAEVDVYLRVTEPVKTDNDDFLVTIGVWPQDGPDEDDNILHLAENVVANRSE